MTSQYRPRPSSTVWQDDDVTRTAKDDAISGVMHRRRWRRRRRYRCAGGGGGGRRGLSDGRTFLLHVASVSLLSASPAFAYGSAFPVYSASPESGIPILCSLARDVSIDGIQVNSTIGYPNASSGKGILLLLFAITFFSDSLNQIYRLSFPLVETKEILSKDRERIVSWLWL